MDVGGLGYGFDFHPRSGRAGIADVPGDGAVEQGGVLQDRGDRAAQTLQRDARDVLPVGQYAALVRLENWEINWVSVVLPTPVGLISDSNYPGSQWKDTSFRTSMSD